MSRMKAISISGLATLALMLTMTVPLAFSEEKTIVGHVRDSQCRLKMDAKGAKHAKCAADCAKAGVPLVLEEKGTGKLYMVLADQDKVNPNTKLAKHVEEEVKITGDVVSQGGLNAITASKVEAVK